MKIKNRESDLGLGRGNIKCKGPGAVTKLSMFRNSKEGNVAGRVTKERKLGTWSRTLCGLDSKGNKEPWEGVEQENSAKCPLREAIS